MGSSFKCIGRIGSTQAYCLTFDDDYVVEDGWVWVADLPPGQGPDRFGEYIVQADGTYLWHKLPDPPFPVVYEDNKLKNSDSKQEIPVSALPGQVDSRLSAAEGTLASIATAMGLQVQTAQQYAQTAQQAASSAATAKSAVDTAKAAVDDTVAALPLPTKFEIVLATLGAGGVGTAVFANTYSAPPVVIPVTRFLGLQSFTAVPGTPSKTAVSVTGKRSRGTLLLSAGPFEDAVSGDTVQLFVIGR